MKPLKWKIVPIEAREKINYDQDFWDKLLEGETIEIEEEFSGRSTYYKLARKNGYTLHTTPKGENIIVWLEKKPEIEVVGLSPSNVSRIATTEGVKS